MRCIFQSELEQGPTLDAGFMSQVDTGSNEQCLASVRDSRRATSSTLTGSKLENDKATSCVLNTSNGVLAFEARILLTFDVTNAAVVNREGAQVLMQRW
jgi:hypothetical protein